MVFETEKLLMFPNQSFEKNQSIKINILLINIILVVSV